MRLVKMTHDAGIRGGGWRGNRAGWANKWYKGYFVLLIFHSIFLLLNARNPLLFIGDGKGTSSFKQEGSQSLAQSCHHDMWKLNC
jgi:hypothetical protein